MFNFGEGACQKKKLCQVPVQWIDSTITGRATTLAIFIVKLRKIIMSVPKNMSCILTFFILIQSI